MRVSSVSVSTSVTAQPGTATRSTVPDPDFMERRLRGAVQAAQAVVDKLATLLDIHRQKVMAAKTACPSAEVIRELMAAHDSVRVKHEAAQEWLVGAAECERELQRLGANLRDSARAYEAALERDAENEDRGQLHTNYEAAKGALHNWARQWHQYQQSFHGIVGSATPSAESTQQQADPFALPFPAGEEGQIRQLSAMQEQLDDLKERRAGLQAETRDLLQRIKLAAEQQAIAEVKSLQQDYYVRYEAYRECSNRLEALQARYVASIRANLHAIERGALKALASQDSLTAIRVSVTEDEALRLRDKRIDAIEKLHAELTSDQLPPLAQELLEKLDQWHDEAFTLTFVECQVRALGISAEQRLSKAKEAFPPSLRNPTRFRSGDADPPAQDDLAALAAQVRQARNRVIAIEILIADGSEYAHEIKEELPKLQEAYRRYARKYAGADGIMAELRAIVKKNDRKQLDDLAARVCKQLAVKNGLFRCPEIYVEIFEAIAQTYRAIRNYEQLVKEGKPGASRPARTGHRPPAGGRNKPLAKDARRRPAAAADAAPPAKGRGLAASSDDTDIAPATEDVVTPTTLEVPGAGEWQVAGAPPPWTAYTPLGATAPVHLRDTSRALESRASNLWNWDRQSMTGAQQMLVKDECIALIDWIRSCSGGDRQQDERLLDAYTIVCGPGTGDFAGQYQLKVINLDPDVPNVRSRAADGGPGKRPTFHFNLDPGAVADVQAALDERGFG